jgi:hypothetical protein
LELVKNRLNHVGGAFLPDKGYKPIKSSSCGFFGQGRTMEGLSNVGRNRTQVSETILALITKRFPFRQKCLRVRIREAVDRFYAAATTTMCYNIHELFSYKECRSAARFLAAIG